jgi:hypothetical protein
VKALLAKSYAKIDSEGHTDALPRPQLLRRDQFRDQFRLNAFFIVPTSGGRVNEGRADYTPVNLSDIERLFSPAG